MVERTGRVGVYSGRADSAPVSTAVRAPSTAGLTNAIGGFFEELNRAAQVRDGIKSVRAETELQTKYLQYESTLDPLSASYAKDLQEWAEDNYAASADSADFETAEGRRDYEQRMIRFSGAAAMQALQKQVAATADRAVTTRGDAENETLNNIRNDPANAEGFLTSFQQQAERLNKGIPAHVREKMDRAFADEAVLTQAEGMAMGGDIAGARKFLSGATGVSPDSIRAMGRRINELENQQEAERSKALTTVYADALEGVYSGRFTSPEQLDRPEYAELWKERPTARVELRQRIRNEQGQRVAAARAHSASMKAAAKGEYAGFTAAQGDKAWAVTAEALPTDKPNAALDALFKHIYTFTTVPKAVKQSLDRAEFGDDPQALAAAAEVESSIRTRFPGVSTGAGKIYSVIDGLKSTYGMDSVEAATEALKRRKQDPNVLKSTEEETPAALKAAKYEPRTSLAAALDIEPAKLPQEMVSKYNMVLRDQMRENGNDFALASSVAKTQVQQQFLPGITTVGGVERVAPFAPEAQITRLVPNTTAYAPLLGEAITGHLEETLKGKIHPYAPEGVNPWSVVDGQPPVKLEPIPGETERAVRAGELPRYNIFERTPGGYIPLMDKDGAPVTYKAPNWEEMKKYPKIRDKVAADTAVIEQKVKGNAEQYRREENTDPFMWGP